MDKEYDKTLDINRSNVKKKDKEVNPSLRTLADITSKTKKLLKTMDEDNSFLGDKERSFNSDQNFEDDTRKIPFGILSKKAGFSLENFQKNANGSLKYGFEMEKNMQNDANNIVEIIKNQIATDLNSIAEVVQDHHDKKMKLLEIRKLPLELSKGHDAIVNMTRDIKTLTTTKELINAIHTYTSDLRMNIPREKVQSIENHGKYLELLQAATNEESKIEPSVWASPFEDVAKYLGDSENWYTFLNGLYVKFSAYEIQSERERYNVANIEDWGQQGKPQGIKVSENTFEQFLNKTVNYNISEYDNIKNITITQLQLEELNHVLELTLKHRVKVHCIEPHILVKGDYISIKDILTDNVSSNVDIDNACRNFLTVLKSGKFKFLNVFASNTIFIDQDMPFSGLRLQISFMAPKWEVIGARKVELDGAAGGLPLESPTFPLNKLRVGPRAKDGQLPGNNGEDGKAGKPGGAGGIFFGIGEEFINGANLTISSDGGKGGPGQDGGTGQIGINGQNPPMPNSNDYCGPGLSCEGGNTYKGFKCEKTGAHTFCQSNPGNDCSYKIFGLPGGKGGNGGNGGKGGKGGNPGRVVVIELNSFSNISTHNDQGQMGENGIRGIGAVGGKYGDDISVYCRIANLWSWLWTDTWYLKETIHNSQNGPSGTNGITGASIRDMKDPDAREVSHEVIDILNDYRGYLRENLDDRFKKPFLLRFLDHLDGNDSVKSIYDTLGLVSELKSLEEQFHKLNEVIDFVPFYSSLLNRINEYAKCTKDPENSEQYKKVLNYLYTVTLSRIYNIKDDSDSNLIININGYLDLIEKDIEKLKGLQKLSNSVDIINRHKESYKSKVDVKIKEAKKFIEEDITPSIDDISSQIDGKIETLIEETLKLQKQAEKEKEALNKKREELEKTMALRGLFSFMKITSQVTSFLGPVGAIAGSVIGAASSVTESLVLDKKTSQQRPTQLPSSVITDIRSLGDTIKNAKNKKIAHLSKLLEDISEETKKYPEKLSDTSAKIADIQKRLKQISQSKFDFKKVQTLEKELKQELKRKEGELVISTDKKAGDALDMVEKYSHIAQLVEVGFDIYNKFQNDKYKLEALTDAIGQAENKFNKLKQYEEKIYNVIAPMLQNMEDNLHDTANKLDAKSQVALDVTKWQVQGTLTDMKIQMQQLTQGFEVKNDLARCIEKLDEAMTTLINVYDRIQNYQEQQNLANYIADVSSVVASDINITDSKLIDAVNHLELLIKSNLVLREYKAVIEAFKQFVFPFAHLYLKNFTLPSHLELEDNISNLVSKVITQIEGIKSQLEVYKNSVKTYDKYIHTSEFSSHYVSTKPFHVWKNELYKDMLLKLLSGQEVIIKADVMNSPFDKNAIKFSYIDLYFKTRNETVQSKINETLKAFDVSATHIGNSYYKYDNRIYVITSDIQNIEFSFEKHGNGEPVDKNKVYDKIKDGDLMLSPYAMWKIRLTNSTNEISFNELKIYKDEVDLELVGHGSYVKVSELDLMVDRYYKTMDSYKRFDLKAESEEIDTLGSTVSSNCSIKSVLQMEAMTGYMTNSASRVLPSPINFICSGLKENTMGVISNVMKTLQNIFIGAEEMKENNNDLKCEQSNTLTSTSGDMKIDLSGEPSITTLKVTKEEGKGALIWKTETNAKLVDNDLTHKSALLLEEKNGLGLRGTDRLPNESTFSISNSKGYNKPTMLSLSNGQQDVHSIQTVQTLEVNSSLVLADLVSRYVSRTKYASPVDESLLSPPQWIERNINKRMVSSEDEIIKNYHRLLLNLDENGSRSWFGDLKNYVKSAFYFKGFF